MKLSTEYLWVKSSRRVEAWGNDGDFITPEGEIIHAGGNHTLFMMDHPEIFGDNREPEDMVDQGWIRTRRIGGIFSVSARGGMTGKQLSALQEMIQDRCRYFDPRIEIMMNDGEVYELTCNDFDEIKYPNQIKRGLRLS